MKGHAEPGVIERLQLAAREAGLPDSQEAIGKMVGVKQGSVGGWHSGGPSLKNARMLARKLNVCVEWIYTGTGPKRPGPPMDPAAHALWDLWGRLSPDERQQTIGYARACLQNGQDNDNGAHRRISRS